MTSQFRTGADGVPVTTGSRPAREVRLDAIKAMSRPTVADEAPPAKPTRSATAKAARADWIESLKTPRTV